MSYDSDEDKDPIVVMAEKVFAPPADHLVELLRQRKEMQDGIDAEIARRERLDGLFKKMSEKPRCARSACDRLLHDRGRHGTSEIGWFCSHDCAGHRSADAPPSTFTGSECEGACMTAQAEALAEMSEEQEREGYTIVRAGKGLLQTLRQRVMKEKTDMSWEKGRKTFVSCRDLSSDVVFATDPRVLAHARERYEVRAGTDAASCEAEALHLRESVRKLWELGRTGHEPEAGWLGEARTLGERVGKPWYEAP